MNNKIDNVNEKSHSRLLRLEDSSLRLEALHLLRQMLMETFCEKKDSELYVEANEAINEMENKVWKYIIE